MPQPIHPLDDVQANRLLHRPYNAALARPELTGSCSKLPWGPSAIRWSAIRKILSFMDSA